MNELFGHLGEAERGRLVASTFPDWRAPMLAVLTEDYFSDPDWIYERKLDGVRVLGFRKGRQAWLMSRNRKRLDGAYPELVDALAAQRADEFIVDGEIVAFEGRRTSFARLQGRMQIRNPAEARRSGVEVFFYLFDVLRAEGCDTERLPLRARKGVLKRLIAFHDPLRYTAHRNGKGEAYLKDACRRGWEGIIAKSARSTYVHKRSRSWLKFKCGKGQEMVIGGFTAPKGSRKGFGALLLGYYEGDRLRYAGRVGTGFDAVMLRELHDRMTRLARRASPFADEVDRRGVTWVEPKLVGEVGFTEWTGDGRLRHPRFLGLRDDKAARDVRRERPQ